METLLKVGQIEMFRHFIRSNADINEYWAALKICIRNGYEITNPSEWCDYIRLLKHFGMDIQNSKYVCPKDIVSNHDKLVKEGMMKSDEKIMNAKRLKLLRMKGYIRSKRVSSSVFHLQTA